MFISLDRPLRRQLARLRGIPRRSQRNEDLRACTYAGDTFASLHRLTAGSDSPAISDRDSKTLAAVTHNFVSHHFDLLGSGWTMVAHGAEVGGVAGHRYEGSRIVPDQEGRWLERRINRANVAEAKRIFSLLDRDYTPIDWQLDFKSGYRWSERVWYKDIEFAHLPPGIDVKVPWELARMQHLPLLAWAYLCATRGYPGFIGREHYARQFRNQILDFVATNPPRFGVNWYYSMEVALRVCNWVVAYDLFRRFGAVFDSDFESVLARSVDEHAHHIFTNLENTGLFKGNHYLSDVVGLMFATLALPECQNRDAWLKFSVQELLAEVESEFNPDGSNFEASTSYHCLCAEMVIYATALLVGIGKERQKPSAPELRDCAVLPSWYLERLAGMTQFIQDHSKPDGNLIQFGDNDSGRFLKLDPSYRALPCADVKASFANLDAYPKASHSDVYWLERQLERGQIVNAATALLRDCGGHEGTLGAWYVGQLCRHNQLPAPIRSSPYRPALREWTDLERQYECHAVVAKLAWRVVGFNPDLQTGITFRTYPDFGSYVYRSDRVHLVVRCGAVGQNGIGGHAHNDQLAFELVIDGEEIFTDPGSYVYTALPDIRNQYRSLRAHNGPQVRRLERGILDLGLFRLGDTEAKCLHADELRFAGCYRAGRCLVYRMIEIRRNEISVRDWVEGKFSGWGQPTDTPFSPGYGWVFRHTTRSPHVEFSR